MFNICKTCKDLRCGNHAACALKASEPLDSQYRAKLDENPMAMFASLFLAIGIIEEAIRLAIETMAPEMRLLVLGDQQLMSQMRVNIAVEWVRLENENQLFDSFGIPRF